MIRLTGSTTSPLLLFIMLLLSWPSFASLTASVNRNQISEADVIRLTVQLVDETTTLQPDFNVLRRDFDVLGMSGPNQSTSIQITNGRRVQRSSMTWELNLRAKRRGLLTIPPIRVGTSDTQPINIRVVAQSAASKQQIEQFVFFETSVSSNKVYVQEEILYTVKLFYRENVDGNMSSLQLDNAIIEELESEKRYDTITGGRRFFVLEKQYAIYPQASGELILPKQAFSGSRVGRGFFSKSEPLMTFSEEHKIAVLSKPTTFSGENWLPAKSVAIKQSWNTTNPSFTVGEPINRTLNIEARGVAASMLPDFSDLKIDGAKVYADPPTDSQRSTPEGLVSGRKTTVGLVPTKAGTLTLPEISIPWWNTETNQLEIATLPAASFEVKPASGSAAIETAPQPRQELRDTPSEANSTGISSNNQTSTSSNQNTNGVNIYWQYAALVLMLLWLGTLYLYLTKPSIAAKNKQQLDTTNNNVDSKQAYSALVKACKSNHAKEAHGALLKWTKLRFSEFDSIQALSKSHKNHALSEQVVKLEQALYSAEGKADWQGSELAQVVKQLDAQQTEKPKNKALAASLTPA